ERGAEALGTIGVRGRLDSLRAQHTDRLAARRAVGDERACWSATGVGAVVGVGGDPSWLGDARRQTPAGIPFRRDLAAARWERRARAGNRRAADRRCEPFDAYSLQIALRVVGIAGLVVVEVDLRNEIACRVEGLALDSHPVPCATGKRVAAEMRQA